MSDVSLADSADSADADPSVQRVRVPYRPRPHFVPLHATAKRWVFVVAHRRAGKTVALVNQLIRAANLTTESLRLPGMRILGPVLMRPRIWYGVISSTTPPPFQVCGILRGS